MAAKDKDTDKKIFDMYFRQRKTQKEIAQKLGVSQSYVSRVTSKSGIDKRSSHVFLSNDIDEGLAKEIKSKFKLKKVIISFSEDPVDFNGLPLLYRLGDACCNYLNDIIFDGCHITVAHGRTIRYSIRDLIEKNIRVTADPLMFIRLPKAEEQKIPSWANATEIRLKFWMQQQWGNFIIPHLFENHSGEDLILQSERIIQQTLVQNALDRIGNTDILLNSVGPIYKDATMVRLAEKIGGSYEDFVSKGVVGSICHTPVDINGNPVELKGFDKLLITIPLSKLRMISMDKNRHSILVAGGEKKFEIIKVVLEGKYCNTLITDEITSKRLLNV